jgi:glutamate-1-semialdehyde aminotransferase
MISFSLLRYHLFDKGILLRGEGGGFLSTAHTDADIDLIIQAMTDSITELQDAGFFPNPAT